MSLIFRYVLVNLAYIIVLSPYEILSTDAVAMKFGEKVFPALYWLMPIFVASSTFGSVSNGFMNFSRQGRMADHILPSFGLGSISSLDLCLLGPGRGIYPNPLPSSMQKF